MSKEMYMFTEISSGIFIALVFFCFIFKKPIKEWIRKIKLIKYLSFFGIILFFFYFPDPFGYLILFFLFLSLYEERKSSWKEECRKEWEKKEK
jgi:hypothetical protein